MPVSPNVTIQQDRKPVYLLLFMQGLYSIFFQSVLLRELVSRFNGMELTFIIGLSAALVWTATGCGLARILTNQYPDGFRRWAGVCACASPLSAFFAYMFVALALASPQGGVSLWEIIFFCFASSLPFGMVNGMIYGMLSSVVPQSSAGACYAADAFGCAFGGLAFSFFLAWFPLPMAILGVFGFFLPLSAIWLIYRVKLEKWPRTIMLLIIIVTSGLCLHVAMSDRSIRIMKWSKVDPSLIFEESIETPYGRADILRENQSPGVRAYFASRRRSIYSDGSLLVRLPRELDVSYPAAIFAALQPNRENLQVLLIASPFSLLPRFLNSFPNVARVDLITSNRNLLMIAHNSGILPLSSERFQILIGEPRSFLETGIIFNKYDLIMVADKVPDTLRNNRFYTAEFYEQVKYDLVSPGGVFVTVLPPAAGITGHFATELEGTVDATLKKVFPNVVVTPGKNRIFAAGGGNVTVNFKELDDRGERMLDGYREYIPGMISIAFSQLAEDRLAKIIDTAAKTSPINYDYRPVLPYQYLRIFSHDKLETSTFLLILERMAEWWQFILYPFLAVYFICRFLLSRKINRKLDFCSFENGFYAMGLGLILFFLYQTYCGMLYRDIPALFGIFIGGGAFGAWTINKFVRARKVVMIVSMVLPLLLLLPGSVSPGDAKILIVVMLVAAGLATGGAYTFFNLRATAQKVAGLWAWEVAGGAFAAWFFIFFLLPASGFIPCIILLCVLRIPLAFIKTK